MGRAMADDRFRSGAPRCQLADLTTAVATKQASARMTAGGPGRKRWSERGVGGSYPTIGAVRAERTRLPGHASRGHDGLVAALTELESRRPADLWLMLVGDRDGAVGGCWPRNLGCQQARCDRTVGVGATPGFMPSVAPRRSSLAAERPRSRRLAIGDE